VYYEIDDYAAMRDVIEKLVLLYPREQYVMNLAALHGQLGDRKSSSRSSNRSWTTIAWSSPRTCA
jgi:hypothetical protein